MKKLITGILATLACCACFTGCDKITSFFKPSQENPPVESSSSDGGVEEVVTDVDGAAEALWATYDEKIPEKGRKDYTVITKITYPAIGGYTYTVAWSVNVDESIVKIVPTSDKDEATVVVSKSSEIDVPYTLSATVSDGKGNTSDPVTFDRIVEKAPSIVANPIAEAPEADVAYKLYMYQVNKQEDCYFTGKMSTYYLASTDDYNEAVDVYAQPVAGKENTYYLTFEDESGVSQYLSINNSIGTDNNWHYNIGFGPSTTITEAENSFTQFEWNFNSEYNVMTATFPNANGVEGESESCYIGNYSSYVTFRASAMSHIDSEGTCIAKLVQLVDKQGVSVDTKINTEIEQTVQAIQTTFFGDCSYLLPTQGETYNDISIAWEMNDESISNGQLILTNPAQDTSIVLTATVSCADISQSVTVTILHEPKYVNPHTAITTAPVVDTAYTLYMEQPNANRLVYFVGGTASKNYYLQTNKNLCYAVDLMVEYKTDSTEEFFLYYMDGENKQYLNIVQTTSGSNTYTNVNLVENTQGDYPWTITDGVLTASVNGTAYVLGTSNDNTYTTIEAKAATYSPFKAYLTVVESKPKKPSTAQEIMDAAYALKAGESIPVSYTLSGTVTKVNSAYDSGYKNVTVTIEVADVTGENTTIMCYRMTGDGADLIGVGSTITVSGTITNYNGTIEFNSGCSLDSYTLTEENKVDIAIKALSIPAVYVNGNTYGLLTTGAQSSTIVWAGDGVSENVLTVTATETTTLALTATVTVGETSKNVTIPVKLVPAEDVEIVKALYELASGETFGTSASLTGIVKTVGTNTVIIVNGVEDKPVTCYSITNYSSLAVGDVITVTGTLKNYNGTYEFNKGTYVASTTTASNKAIKVVLEENIVLDKTIITAAGEENGITLPSTYLNINLTWKEGENTIDTSKKYFVDPYPSTTEIKTLTVTAIIGEETLTKTFSITVNAIVVSKTMAELATANSWTNAEKVKNDFTLDNNIYISYGSTKGDTGKYYSSNSSLRIYTNGDGYLTISAKNGYEIIAVLISATTSKATLQVQGGAEENIIGESISVNASSITVKPVQTGTSTGNVQITSIEVIYKAVTAA